MDNSAYIRRVLAYLPVPTVRGWLLIGATVASFLVAMVNPFFPVNIFCAFMLALVLASLLTTAGALIGLRLERLPAADGIAGHPLRLPCRVQNCSPLPHPALLVRESLPFADTLAVDTVVPVLAPREQRTVAREMIPRRRGIYPLDQIRVRVGDPAGLFRRERLFSQPHLLRIFPDWVKLSWMPLHLRSRMLAASSVDSLGTSGAGQEFFGVREYRPSDSVRAVHWKSTARHQRLMVRQYEDNAISQVSLFLDTHAGRVAGDGVDSNLEYLIRVMASIAHYLGGIYCRVLFRCSGQSETEYTLGLSQNVKTRILDHLLELEPRPGAEMAELLANSLRLIPSNSLLYCLTMDDPPALTEVFQFLMARGVDICWIHAPAQNFLRQPASARTAQPHSALVQTPLRLRQFVVQPGTDIRQILTYD